jgi:hypothetical protein
MPFAAATAAAPVEPDEAAASLAAARAEESSEADYMSDLLTQDQRQDIHKEVQAVLHAQDHLHKGLWLDDHFDIHAKKPHGEDVIEVKAQNTVWPNGSIKVVRRKVHHVHHNHMAPGFFHEAAAAKLDPTKEVQGGLMNKDAYCSSSTQLREFGAPWEKSQFQLHSRQIRRHLPVPSPDKWVAKLTPPAADLHIWTQAGSVAKWPVVVRDPTEDNYIHNPWRGNKPFPPPVHDPPAPARERPARIGGERSAALIKAGRHQLHRNVMDTARILEEAGAMEDKAKLTRYCIM